MPFGANYINNDEEVIFKKDKINDEFRDNRSHEGDPAGDLAVSSSAHASAGSADAATTNNSSPNSHTRHNSLASVSVAKRTLPAMKRCDYSDLLPENCGHCQGTPDLEDGPAGLPEQVVGTWAMAQYPGECGCGCNSRVREGDDIVLVGDAGARVWCLLDHTRGAA